MAHRGVSLHFTNDGEPFVMYSMAGSRGRLHALAPAQDGWHSNPLERALQAHHADWQLPPILADGAERLWAAWRSADRASAKLLGINPDDPDDVLGPWTIDTDGGWPQSLSVSPDGRVLVTLAQSALKYKPVAVLVDPPATAQGEPAIQAIPMSAQTSALQSDAAWSPDARAHFASPVGAREARIWRLEGGDWREIARVSQTRRGEIFGLRLFFRSDGKPIVVWEDFFPHHR